MHMISFHPTICLITLVSRILDTCVSQLQPQISACAGNDYACLCQQYGNLLTCYDNCPGDPARSGASQQQSQNCMAASAYGTTTLMVASSTSSGSSSATSSADSDSDSSETETTSGSAASATETGAAAPLSVEITGGLLAAVAAGFGFFL